MNRFRFTPTDFPVRLRMVLLLVTGWLAIQPFWALSCHPTALAAVNRPEVPTNSCCQAPGEDAPTTLFQLANALPWSSPACGGTCTLSGCDPEWPPVESQGSTGLEHRRLAVGPLPIQMDYRRLWPESPSASHRPRHRFPHPRLPAYLAFSALLC